MKHLNIIIASLILSFSFTGPVQGSLEGSSKPITKNMQEKPRSYKPVAALNEEDEEKYSDYDDVESMKNQLKPKQTQKKTTIHNSTSQTSYPRHTNIDPRSEVLDHLEKMNKTMQVLYKTMGGLNETMGGVLEKMNSMEKRLENQEKKLETQDKRLQVLKWSEAEKKLKTYSIKKEVFKTAAISVGATGVTYMFSSIFLPSLSIHVSTSVFAKVPFMVLHGITNFAVQPLGIVVVFGVFFLAIGGVNCVKYFKLKKFCRNVDLKNLLCKGGKFIPRKIDAISCSLQPFDQSILDDSVKKIMASLPASSYQHPYI